MTKKKTFNLEAIVKIIKEKPEIAKKYGINHETVTPEVLQSIDGSTMMDMLMEYSSPIKNLN